MFNSISRDAALKIHFILDQLLPPALRDSRWFMTLPLWLVYRRHYKLYLTFKEKVHAMTEEEFRNTYITASETAITRTTDLNSASIDLIQRHVSGRKVIDVGCGHGYMAGLLASRFETTAVDIVIPEALRKQYPAVTFHEGNVESLPFADQEFDTVVCSHTLEHVRDVRAAVSELRRIGRKLIIVVPRQRPYKYTFDLHISFFPYLYSLPLAIGKTSRQTLCLDADGDTFYVENVDVIEDHEAS
jgi:SAM-dependent methyltransferase